MAPVDLRLSRRYPLAIWQPSPNFSPSRPDGAPEFLVVHVTDGQPDARRSADRFCDPKTEASPHFLVGRRSREVYQHVELRDRAWHAKGWNSNSIGIEHVARTPGELDRQWIGLSQEKRRALLPEGVPLDPESDDDPGFPPTEEQLQTSAELAAWLCDLLSWEVSRERLRGHCECPGTSHRDCGRDVSDGGIWPWDRYLAMVQERLDALRAGRR